MAIEQTQLTVARLNLFAGGVLQQQFDHYGSGDADNAQQGQRPAACGAKAEQHASQQARQHEHRPQHEHATQHEHLPGTQHALIQGLLSALLQFVAIPLQLLQSLIELHAPAQLVDAIARRFQG